MVGEAAQTTEKKCSNSDMKNSGREIVMMSFSMLRLTFPLRIFSISNWNRPINVHYAT